MVPRERILEAAARVYAKHGFRGATTRLIATEAEVNEVTLFRTFGSKGALLEAVLMHSVAGTEPLSLPLDPADPLAELTDFIRGNMERVAAMRPMLIHTMGEMEDRPEAQEFACRGRRNIHDTISAYIRRLQELGIADRDADVMAAAVMLMGTVISDVMGRPMVPDVYPPLDKVAAQYARLFLRALGAPATPAALPLSHSTAPNS